MKLFRPMLVGFLAIVLSWGSISPANSATWQEQMLTSLNAIRADKGLKPLTMCKSLTQSAQNYAKTMATQDFFSHEGKDGSTLGQRIQNAGYKWRNSRTASGIAENIAAGQGSVKAVMKDWKNSTGHFENMNNKILHCIKFLD